MEWYLIWKDIKKKFDVDLLKFIGSIPDVSSCSIKFKKIRDAQGDIYGKCGSKILSGKKSLSHTNVRNVKQEPLYQQELLWKQASYQSNSGLSHAAW